MTEKTLKQETAELEKQGWEVDAAPRALERRESFPDYDATVNYLVGVGKRAAAAGAMPSICVRNGNEVAVRIGRPPSPTLTAQEIELAKSLTASQ